MRRRRPSLGRLLALPWRRCASRGRLLALSALGLVASWAVRGAVAGAPIIPADERLAPSTEPPSSGCGWWGFGSRDLPWARA